MVRDGAEAAPPHHEDFETALKQRLLTMRIPCGRATSPLHPSGSAHRVRPLAGPMAGSGRCLRVFHMWINNRNRD